MSLKPLYSEGGFGISNASANTTTTVIYANSDISGNTVSVSGNLTVANVTNLGSVSNVKISGGTANYVLKTDGAGNLSWTAQTGGNGGSSNSISNMPSYIESGSSFTLSANYQGLFAEPIVVDGTLEIFGNLIDVSGNSYITGNGTLSISNINTTGTITGNTVSANTITANGTPVATTGKAIAMAIVFGF